MILPGFEFVSLLGRGGMGAVYLARQVSLERLVAVKFMPPVSVIDDPAYVDRFRNEAKALAQLNHPGIIQVYDFGETPEGLLYFVMEYVEGEDLHQRLAKSTSWTLPLREAVNILVHACDALEFAHTHGVVHRDIKPANLLLTSKGRVKVADFGLAKRQVPGTREFTQNLTAIGTPDYSAPEIFTLGAAIDHRADLFSLGATFYEMTTGRPPSGAFDPPSLLNPDLDSRADQFVAKAMRADPGERFQSASEFAGALEVLLHSASSVHRRSLRHQRVRALLIGTAVAALLGVIGLGVWYSSKSPESRSVAGETTNRPSDPAGMKQISVDVSGPEQPQGKPAALTTTEATLPATDLAPSPATVESSSPGSVASGPVASESKLPAAPKSASVASPILPGSPSQLAERTVIAPAGATLASRDSSLAGIPKPAPPFAPIAAAALPVPPELLELHAGFARTVEELVDGPGKTALDQLIAGYRAALERALAEKRRAAPASPHIAFFETELRLIADNEPLPLEAAGTPPDLVRLRSILREKQSMIEEERTQGLLGLLTPHIGKLIQLEQSFTRAGRAADAAAVKAHREKLGTDPLARP